MSSHFCPERRERGDTEEEEEEEARAPQGRRLERHPEKQVTVNT